MPLVGTSRLRPASSEVARDINQRIVFDLIRRRQPLSRADLARASGLQRSTVSLIVDGLVEGGWVLEEAAVSVVRGRRPTYLRISEDRVLFGVDIRAGATTVALADINGHFQHQEQFPTPADPAEAVARISAAIQKIRQLFPGRLVEGLGVCVPGRTCGGRLVFVPNLPWLGFDLATALQEATGLPVEVENAANASVLAAVWFERSHGTENLVCITVSEGVGAGILINGRLGRGVNSMAGELGHVTLDPNGPLCGCGNRGCWEVFASNRAALRYYRELVPQSQPLSFHSLMDLADNGDAAADEALRKMAHYLGLGLRTVVVGLAPERILLVGEFTRCYHRFRPIVEAQLQARVLPGSVPPIIEPELEGVAMRLRGTVALLLQRRFAVAATHDN